MKIVIDIPNWWYDNLKTYGAKTGLGKAVCTSGVPLTTELEKIKTIIYKKHKINCDLNCKKCIYYPCNDSHRECVTDIKIIDKYIKELNNDIS